MCMDTNFYPRVWVKVRIFAHSLFTDGQIIALPNPNPTDCHPEKDKRSFRLAFIPMRSTVCAPVTRGKLTGYVCIFSFPCATFSHTVNN
jgi:hypothetical protein